MSLLISKLKNTDISTKMLIKCKYIAIISALLFITINNSYANKLTINDREISNPISIIRYIINLYNIITFSPASKSIVEAYQYIDIANDKCEGLPKKIKDNIEKKFQKVTNQILQRIEKIQNADPHLQNKMPIGKVKFVIIEDCKIHSSCSKKELPCNKCKPSEIRIPIKLLAAILIRLQSEYDKNTNQSNIEKFLSIFDKYVPLIEFDEILRFIIAHEATHLWLHKSGADIYEREIEADAWGILLSSSLSDAFRFRIKVSKALANGINLNKLSFYEKSLLVARSGPEVLHYIHDKQGIFFNESNRQNPKERITSIYNKYNEQVEKYKKLLESIDSIAFAISNFIRYERNDFFLKYFF